VSPVELRGAPAREPRRHPVWPEEIADPPAPGSSAASVAAYVAWLTGAAEVLGRRVETNSAELERLASEWDHVVRNAGRLRPEEIGAVAEGQARVREAIAADRALRELVEMQRRQVAGWAEALGGPLSDPALVGALLDGAAAERAAVTAEMFEISAEAISGAVLDLEVVRRESLREPERAPVGLFEAGRRLSAAAEDLRERARTGDLRRRPEESLLSVLQRCAQVLGTRVRVAVSWTGPQAVDPRAAVAIAAVVEECLRQLATLPGGEAEVAVAVEPQGAATVRITAAGGGRLPVEGAVWLARARAHAALAQGRLACAPAGEGMIVELRAG
jgi:hypothetical protein